MNCGMMNHRNGDCIWAKMMPFRSSVPANITAPMIDAPIASSYEIICADDRSPPISEYLLFDDQPASIMP